MIKEITFHQTSGNGYKLTVSFTDIRNYIYVKDENLTLDEESVLNLVNEILSIKENLTEDEKSTRITKLLKNYRGARIILDFPLFT